MADLVLGLHALFIAFVVGGFVLIVTGIILKRPWARNFWFRATHLLAVVITAVLPVTDKYCPLTILESRLRVAAGRQAYSGGFIQHWIHKLIYYDLPLNFFAVLYTLFALAVLCTYIVSPPRPPDFLWPKKSKKRKN